MDKDDQLNFVKISIDNKYVFTKKQESDEIIFPELEHNMYIELKGHVTRGNGNTNTIGFEYLKHILTCLPSNGNIKTYKQLLFTNCIIKGHIDRLNEQGELNEKKPRIKFIDLVEIKKQISSKNCFLIAK